MDVVNETPFVARIIRREIGNNAYAATLIVKATFERDASGRLVPAGEQMPYVDEPLATAFGIFHSDTFAQKVGVDICVMGTVRPGAPVRTTRVSLSVDALRSELSVVGERRWVPRVQGLVPSDPAPFDEMPLAYTHAYGGATEHEDEKHVWTDNPAGRGFYLSEEGAAGQLLPNIEAAEGPALREWRDRPGVAGWGPYPFFWGMRAREGLDVSAVTAESPFPKVKATLNNNAHPSLVAAAVPAGSLARIRGMRPAEVMFEVPGTRLIAEIDIGGRTSEAEGRLDGVFLWVDADRLTITHRCHFDYVFREGERRTVRVRDAAASRS